jgi:hypothetical protein
MISRLGGRLVTSPAAFLIAWFVDIAAFAIALLGQRLSIKRRGRWRLQRRS